MASPGAACPIFEGSQRSAGVRSDPNYMETAAPLLTSTLTFCEKALDRLPCCLFLCRSVYRQRAIGWATVKAIGRQRTGQAQDFCRRHRTIPMRSFEFTQRAPYGGAASLRFTPGSYSKSRAHRGTSATTILRGVSQSAPTDLRRTAGGSARRRKRLLQSTGTTPTGSFPRSNTSSKTISFALLAITARGPVLTQTRLFRPSSTLFRN